MRIKWKNVIATLLIIILISLLPRLLPMLATVAEDVGALSDSGGDPAMGIPALGIICITVLGIFIVLANRR